jgi:tetratricopeptide (TPR) repeat protein
MSREAAEAIRRPRGQVGRAGRSPGQLWQVPTFFLGLLAFIAAFVTAPSREDHTLLDFTAELAALRQGLEPDQEKPAVVVAWAENLLAKMAQHPRTAAEIRFLAGSAYFRQANHSGPEGAEENRKKALHHLEEALALGVASDDLMPLQFRLGYTLYQQGKDPRRAIDLMAHSVDKGADRPAQGYGLLVQAYLALPKPNLDAALLASQRQLELTDERNVEEMAQARLTRGELLLRKEQRADALKELDRISPAAPRPLRLKARLLQTRICEEEGLWNRAVPIWSELLKDADAVPGGKAGILYALGLAYFNGDPARPEQAMACWEEAFALGGSEGEAAGIRLGEVRLYGPKADVKAALDIWTKVLAPVRTPSDYKIQVLELSRTREIFDNACRYFLESQNYDQARLVADLYMKIAPPGVAEERSAQATEGLARELKNKAATLAAEEAARTVEEARTQYHRAAVAYEEAAAARAEEAQAAIYWRSAQCYVAANDFNRAGGVLSKFVALEQNEGRLAEGWLALATAYVAQGNKDQARRAYYKCIEFPRTRFASHARFQLALEEMAKKNYPQAKAILQQNLTSPGPFPDRSAHEESIYKMAELVYLMQEFDQAGLYYKQATRQYPNHPGAPAARDKLGDCYRKLADLAQTKMLAAKDEQTRAHHGRTREEWLKKGADAYEALADDLEHKSRRGSLVAEELGLLRNALFGSADLYFDMNQFVEALRRYESLQEKYRKQVEGLIACQRVWRCVGVMIDPPELARQARKAAADAVKKAALDLQSMPADSDAFRGGPGVWTKDRWEGYLNWITQQLNPVLTPSRPAPVVN